MASYGALRHATIGQYIPTGSLVHRLDPRTKLLAVALLIVAVLLATSYAANVALTLIVLAVVWLARLSVADVMMSIRPTLPIILILVLFQIVFYSYAYATPGATTTMLVSWGLLRISAAGLRLAVVSLLRFLDLILLTSLLTNTTTTSSLTQGVESLLRPLSAIGLPGHELAFVAAIALRFVPILGEQLESIVMAQTSRGVSADAGGRWHFLHNTRRLAMLVVPLFVDAYRRSEEMILAMQARCYRGGRSRSHLRELTLSAHDYLSLGLVALFSVGIVLLQRLPLP